MNQVHVFQGGFDLKVTTVRGKTVWGLKKHRAGKHTHHDKFFISAIFGPRKRTIYPKLQ